MHCVIVGFALFDTSRKYLFDYETPTSDPHEIPAKNINPYLVDYANLVLTKSSCAAFDVPEIHTGANLQMRGTCCWKADEERSDICARITAYTNSYFRSSAHTEFINGERIAGVCG